MVDSDGTYDLNLVQGERYSRGFRYKPGGTPRDLAAYSFAGQARQKESDDADLLIDLTSYLALDDSDSTLLVLDVPATATAALVKARATASWDIFIWPTSTPADSVLLVQGACTVDLASTDIEVALA